MDPHEKIQGKRFDMPRKGVNPCIALWIFALLSIRTTVYATLATNQNIKIQTINYKWIDEEKAEVTACLESEADGTPFGQVDLLVTNALGRAWRTRGGGGALRKTEKEFCFAGISLEKKDLVKTLSFKILENGSDESIQELETFFIVPEVTPMNEDVYEICWNDPEGLAFALAEEDVAQPLASPPAGCHECCLYLTSRSPGDLVTLETAGTKESLVRQLVQVRLPENLEENQTKPHAAVDLTIKELHKVSRDDDPSGREQNVKVFLDPHQATEADDFLLILILLSSGQQEFYAFLESNDDATELEFEGNFQDSTLVMISAMKDGVNVGFGSVGQTITDPGSRVARVGDASAPSLRVDPGARDQVDVPGKSPCAGGSGPCYYVGQSAPPPPLCDDLPKIKFCDAVVSEVQNPADVPALELRNRQELRVQQPRPDGAWTEVVVSSARDDSILSPDCFGCDDLGHGMCSQPVAVADDLDGFDATLVVLGDDGYVTASLAVPFEVHGFAALSLSSDVVQVEVDPRSGGTYEVTLPGLSPPPAATQECQVGSPCRVWFAEMDGEPEISVSVRKESNTIYEDRHAGPPPPSSRVERLTSRDADASTDVEVASSRPVTRADLVTFSDDVATDADCESLAATSLESGYSVAAASRGAGEWNFVVVGYGDGDAPLEAGRAKVTLSDMDSRVGVVGAARGSPDASVRVDVGSLDGVVVEGVGSCAKADSPCYFLTEALTAGTLRHCVTIANSAGGGSGDVDQCDASFTPFKQMAQEPMLELVDRTILKVTPEKLNFHSLEVVVFNPQTDDLLSKPSPLCTPDTDESCIQEVNITEELTDFKVLVVAVDAAGETQESILSPFYDFMTRVQHFNNGNDLEVRWRTSTEQTFSISIEDDVSGGFTKTSMTCGQDLRTCKAYFTKLSTEVAHKVKVTKDKTAVSVSVQPSQDTTTSLSITRISKVSTLHPQAQLTISSDIDVEGVKYLEYVVIEPPVGSDIVQHIAFADFDDVIHTGNIITFEDVESPKTGVEVTVMVIAHTGDSVDSDALAFGKELAIFEEIKFPIMTKVGTEAFQSLRVETGEMEVKVNGFLCPSSTICYYLEPQNILEPPEVCRMATPTLEQCDMTAAYVQPEVLIDPSVELRLTGVPEEDLIITAEFSDTSLTMEVKLYTNSEVLTPEPLTCNIAGHTPHSCIFKVEPDVTDFKILLMALDIDSTVTESTVVEFEDFMPSVQHFHNGADLEVRWRTSSEQTFSISTEDDISLTRSSITCGQELRTCKAYFTKLNPEVIQNVKVANDNTAVSVLVQADLDATTSLSIRRISKVSTLHPQAQLTISSDIDVEGVKYLEYVVIEPPVGSDIVQHIAFADFDDVIHTGNIITFEDVEAPKTGVEVTVMVIAHTGDGVDSDALAFGKELATFEEIKFPIMTKVGTEAFQSLRVETGEMEVKVNGFLCPSSTICYYLEPQNILEPPEVCRMATPTLEQCDMTAAYVQPEVLIDPLMVQLSFNGKPEEDLTVAAEFSEASLSMETKLYTSSGDLTPELLTCDITGQFTKTCTVKVELNVTEFKILLVALDSESTVKESSVVEFEDFQTRIQQITSDAIEVRWRASQNQEYEVEIFPEIEGSFSNTLVLCGGEEPEDSNMCLAYFIALTLNKDYTASVRVRGDMKYVSASVKMETVQERINITDLTLTRTEGTRGLNVCFMEDQNPSEEENLVYKLVAVDANGRQLQMMSNSSHSSLSVVKEKLCLGPLPLDPDFDLGNKVWILVSHENLDTQKVLVGHTELFLLDLHEEDVRQMGAKTLRVKWTNNNEAPSFDVGIGVDDLSSVECGAGKDAGGECMRYLHVEGTSKQVTVTLREIGLSVNQEVQVTATLKELTDIRINKTEINREDRLRVCFESNSADSLYLLALENEEGDVQEDPQLRPYNEDGLTCVLSNDAIQAEGYLSLWTLVTAFDVSGAVVQASGNTYVTDFFLSPKRRVNAALNANTHDLLASWFLFSDPRAISSYDVTLEETTADGRNELVTLGNTESSYVFNGTTAGRYAVCVVASVKENNVTSQKVCSAILSILQSDVAVPNVTETSLKSSGPTKVLVTWQNPQEDADVSSYVITWSSSPSFSPTPPPSSSNLLRPAYSAPHPLGLIRRASPVSDGDEHLSFMVVPASTSSIEVENLVDSQSYEMCVSSVKSDVMGDQKCSTVNQGAYQPLDLPKDLVHENEALHWVAVPGAATYQVEWRPRYEGGLSEGGLKEVTGTTWPTQDLSPGSWVVEVRAASDTSVSEVASIRISKIGIEVGQATQTNNSQLEVSWWEEPVPSCAQTPCKYTITLSNNGMVTIYTRSCLGRKGDCTQLLDVAGASEIEVKVEREMFSSSARPRVYAFKAVEELRQSFFSGGGMVELRWAPTEGAQMYNVTLFADATLASVRRAEMISRESYTLNGGDLVGDVFQIQPCADVSHCGDPQSIVLQITSENYDYTVIIIVSVSGGIVGIVGSLVSLVLRRKLKKEEKKLDRQEEPPLPLPVYDEWGARRLGQRARPPPQVPVYDEWGARRLGQRTQPIRPQYWQ
ncbi:uncharacterized protein LOC119573375 isoform X2 [Penaeus monodon]|uniref:uncharacterized protein LOC119573375 isoform X2 n=1 Tax=Penaeus monodon TaxID=6687 RepID=UPI0018A6E4D3|nr:uncharacterized protein LOC119573375 isoform X2 [Penaeus monodon]